MAPVVVVAYRFAPGTKVRLVKRVGRGFGPSPIGLRPSPIDPVVDERVVDAHGIVRFDQGIEPFTTGWVFPTPGSEIGYPQGRYWACGLSEGVPLELPCVAVDHSRPDPRPPVMPDRPRLIRPPARTPTAESAPEHGGSRGRQEDVPPGTWQASDTATGIATPLP